MTFNETFVIRIQKFKFNSEQTYKFFSWKESTEVKFHADAYYDPKKYFWKIYFYTYITVFNKGL